jgi:hypothetical protein
LSSFSVQEGINDPVRYAGTGKNLALRHLFHRQDHLILTGVFEDIPVGPGIHGSDDIYSSLLRTVRTMIF